MPDSTCSIDGCAKTAHNKRRGWCQMHYGRFVRNGTTDIVTRFACVICGAAITKFGTGPKPKYCSRACSISPLRKPPPVDGRCMGCSALLPPQGAGKTRKYCTSFCRHIKVRRPASVDCAQCGVLIDMTQRNTKGHLRYPAYTKVCESCRKPNRYPLTAEQLAERDGPACAGCGIEVDFTAVKPDPFSPSVDHIIPWSRGGANESHNLQLMHLRCNIVKGVKLDN